MRSPLFLAIIISCGVATTSATSLRAAESAARIGVADSMATITPGPAPSSGVPEAAAIAWQKPLRVELARNEFESGQIVVEAPVDRPLRNVQVEVGPLVRRGWSRKTWPAHDISLWQVGLVEAINLWEPHQSLGWLPDPLLPLNRPLEVPAGQRRSILVHFFAASKLSAGVYRGEVFVSAADMPKRRVPVEVTVWDFSLPVEQHFTLSIPIWGGQMDAMYPGSQTPERRRAYLDMLYDHRVAPFPLAEEEIPHAIERGMRDFCLVCFGKDGVEPEKAKSVGEIAARWHDRGWDKTARTYVLLGDEAPRDGYPFQREQGRLMGKLAPGVARRFTVSPEMIQDIAWIDQQMHGLADTVILAALPSVTDRLSRDVRTAGLGLWWYYVAQHYYIPSDNAEARLVFWRHWKYQVPGQLHWGMTYWGDENVAGRGGVKWPDIPWDTKACRSGDGYLVYPAPGGAAFWPSVRLEQLRDGIEDYEYFHLLKTLTARLPENVQTAQAQSTANRQLLDLGEALIQSYAQYDKRPETYRAYRQRLAQAIIATQKLIKNNP